MIDVRVRDDDAADVFERQPARAQRGAQCVKCRRVFRSCIDQRQFIAFSEVAIDGTDWKRRWNCDGLQIIENGTPLDAANSACYTFGMESNTGGE